MRKKHLYLSWMVPAILVLSLSAQQNKKPTQKVENPELKNLHHKIELKGGEEITTAEKAGDLAQPREKFPNVHFVQAKAFFTEQKDRSKTPSGLYILDSDFIPKQLPEILKKEHLTLKPDGTLLNAKGGKVSMLLWHKLVAVNEKKASAEHDKGWNILPVVYAAYPYPLSYVSAWGSWYADNGFCRSLTADTGGDAWGPQDQYGNRPHTQIELIETRAWASGGGTADNTCSNCSSEFSQSVADYGCWWPAYGGGTYSYAALTDGWFSWSWQWWGD